MDSADIGGYLVVTYLDQFRSIAALGYFFNFFLLIKFDLYIENVLDMRNNSFQRGSYIGIYSKRKSNKHLFVPASFPDLGMI